MLHSVGVVCTVGRMEPLMTHAAVARRHGVDPSTVVRWRKFGLLKGQRDEFGVMRITVASVGRYETAKGWRLAHRDASMRLGDI